MKNGILFDGLTECNIEDHHDRKTDKCPHRFDIRIIAPLRLGHSSSTTMNIIAPAANPTA